jgi:hypothetical protein
VFGWIDQAGTYLKAGWTTYTPTFTKNDGSTVITPLTQSFKYHKIGSIVHIVGYFTCNAADLDGSTFFTVPFVVGWTGSITGPDALSGRGASQPSDSGVGVIMSVYFNGRLRASTGTSDTNVRIHATYETA